MRRIDKFDRGRNAGAGFNCRIYPQQNYCGFMAAGSTGQVEPNKSLIEGIEVPVPDRKTQKMYRAIIELLSVEGCYYLYPAPHATKSERYHPSTYDLGSGGRRRKGIQASRARARR